MGDDASDARRHRRRDRRRCRCSCATPCATARSASARRSSSCTRRTTVGRVPSNLAAPEEVVALAERARRVRPRRDRVHPALVPATATTTPTVQLIRDMAEASGKPIDLNVIVWFPHATRRLDASIEFVDERSRRRARLHPMYASNRQRRVLHARERRSCSTTCRRFREVLAQPSTRRAASACVIRQCANGCAPRSPSPPDASFPFTSRSLTRRRGARPEHAAWVGRTRRPSLAERGERSVRRVPRPLPRRRPADRSSS